MDPINMAELLPAAGPVGTSASAHYGVSDDANVVEMLLALEGVSAVSIQDYSAKNDEVLASARHGEYPREVTIQGKLSADDAKRLVAKFGALCFVHQNERLRVLLGVPEPVVVEPDYDTVPF